jgi:hypothetical protein
LSAKPKVRWASPISQSKNIPARSSSQEQFFNNNPNQYPVEFSKNNSPILTFTNHRTTNTVINPQSPSSNNVLLFQHPAPKPPPSYQYSVLAQNNLRHLGYTFHHLPPPDLGTQAQPCTILSNSQVTIVQGEGTLGKLGGEEQEDGEYTESAQGVRNSILFTCV